MRIKRNDGKFQMYVISAVDIQRIEGCTYSQAYNKMKKYDYFYINSRRYILASDYFTNGYLVSEAMYYSHLGEGVDTKYVPPCTRLRILWISSALVSQRLKR